MQITIDLPDNLPLTESDLRREVAIAKPHLFNSFNLLLIPSTIPLVVLSK